MNDRDSWDEEDDPELEQLLALDLLFGRNRPLPDDLDELLIAIRDMLYKRMMVEGATDTYPFEGYEAYDVRTGGMGFVIEARDPELDRKVAIKLWARVDPKATEALLAEAKTLAKLSHPNVVTVYATGRWRDRVYFVMEWVEGQDGHKWLEQLRDWREVRDVFVQAGEGLAAAHDAGIQHRDFKPSNMLIGEDGRVLVADFGIAASLGVDEGQELGAREGRASGTPIYMAPERLRGGSGDARSDQFSFCVALWRGLHGYRPFSAATVEELIEVIEAGAIRPAYPDAEVPHWLSRVVRKGLEADPERRWADMRELLRAMQDEPPEQEEAPDIDEDEEPERPEGVVMHSPPSESESPNWRLYFYATLVGALFALAGLLAVALPGRGVPPPAEPPSVEPAKPTLTPPERVLEQLAGSCTVPIGTALTRPSDFWASCDDKLKEAHNSWLADSSERELARTPTQIDSVRVGEAFLEKARILAKSGGYHVCELVEHPTFHRKVLKCRTLTESGFSKQRKVSPESKNSIQIAVAKAIFWGHAAATDPLPDREGLAAATSLTDRAEEVAAALPSPNVSRSK